MELKRLFVLLGCPGSDCQLFNSMDYHYYLLELCRLAYVDILELSNKVIPLFARPFMLKLNFFS